MSTTPSPVLQPRNTSLLNAEKRKLRSTIRGLVKSGENRFGGGAVGIEVLANDLALRSSHLVLLAVGTNEKLTRAVNRKGRDAKRLFRRNVS